MNACSVSLSHGIEPSLNRGQGCSHRESSVKGMLGVPNRAKARAEKKRHVCNELQENLALAHREESSGGQGKGELNLRFRTSMRMKHLN